MKVQALEKYRARSKVFGEEQIFETKEAFCKTQMLGGDQDFMKEEALGNSLEVEKILNCVK
jgi:hypothetical protein